MTDYTKSTNFTSKDSLASGNPLKIIKGAEFDTEFTNIATAVNSKAELNSPAFTGTPTVPNVTAGDATAKIANTAFVTAALQACYPVGSLYLNASSATNPATLLGFGTWTSFGAGKMPVGYGAGDPLFGTVGNTGGSRDAIVPSHTHTINDPGHNHTYVTKQATQPQTGSSTQCWWNESTGTTSTSTTGITVNSTGSSVTNANLPPYITVYMWQRTA